MNRVLIIKMSSMGDVIHTLPAITDAGRAHPHIQFHWVVEENFAEIPAWHPLVTKVFPIGLRRWRARPFSTLARGEWRRFKKELTSTYYDAVIDAQSLLKSALIARMAQGPRWGLNRQTAREPWASYFYHHRVQIHTDQHAITRLRQLFATTLNYPVPSTNPDAGLSTLKTPLTKAPYLVYIHSTSRESKLWPETYWRQLIDYAQQHQLQVKLPWGNSLEHERAQRLAKGYEHVEILGQQTLTALAQTLTGAQGIVAVDTGLSHLAAALATPTVTLYGPTDPYKVGTQGVHQAHLKASHLSEIKPDQVWEVLTDIYS